MVILGITGGIATGKSTVTGVFAEMGAPAISADTIARRLLSPDSPLTHKVLAAFPTCRLSDNPLAVDRKQLAELIFHDDTARRKLEALTHPPIIEVLKEQIAQWKAQSLTVAVAEIPLLFEAHLETLPDKIVVVSCSEELQLRRLQERLGINKEEAQRMIDAQWPLEKKIAWADYLITTDSDLETTKKQVAELYQLLV